MLRVTREPGGRTTAVPLIRRPPSPVVATARDIGGSAVRGKGAGDGEGGASLGEGAAILSSPCSLPSTPTIDRLTLALRASWRLWRRAAMDACCAAWAARTAASGAEAAAVCGSAAGGTPLLLSRTGRRACSPTAWLPRFSAATSLACDKPVPASCWALRLRAAVLAANTPSGAAPAAAAAAGSPPLLPRGAVLRLGPAAVAAAAASGAGGGSATGGASLLLPPCACCTVPTTAVSPLATTGSTVSLARPASGSGWAAAGGGATSSAGWDNLSLLLVRLTRTRTTAPAAELALSRGCTVMLALGWGASASTWSAEEGCATLAAALSATPAAPWDAPRPPCRAGGVQSVGRGTCLRRADSSSSSSSSPSAASARHDGVELSRPDSWRWSNPMTEMGTGGAGRRGCMSAVAMGGTLDSLTVLAAATALGPPRSPPELLSCAWLLLPQPIHARVGGGRRQRAA